MCEEHGTQLRNCIVCNPKLVCVHKKRKKNCTACKESVGTYVPPKPQMKCEHGVLKYYCIKCRPGLACRHNKLFRNCKKCNQGAICKHRVKRRDCQTCPILRESKCEEHRKVRMFCDECNPDLAKLSLVYCDHGNLKVFCTETGCNVNMRCPIQQHEGLCGACVCEHGQIRFHCNDCNTVLHEYDIDCEHDRVRILCLECNPSFKCRHDEHKMLCGICPDLCIHNEHHIECVQCRMERKCNHGRERYRCDDCKPSDKRLFCKHGLKRTSCPTCPILPVSKCKAHNRVRIFCDQCNPGLAKLSLVYCEHGTLKLFCTECNPAVKCVNGYHDGPCDGCLCPHDTSPFSCIDCNIVLHEYDKDCEHGEVSILCLECTPSVKCQHGNHKALCTICPELCVHNNNKSWKECEQCEREKKNICKHGFKCAVCLTCPMLPQSKCKEHGKVRIFCNRCNPGLAKLSLVYCEHGSLRLFCTETGCNPGVKCVNGYHDGPCNGCDCPHDTSPFSCIDCNVVLHEYDKDCEHDEVSILCLECNPSLKCQHGNHKALCGVCPQLCIHSQYHRDCEICDRKK